jgi:ribonuclease VapC
MVIDSSAVLAILFQEPEAPIFAAAIEAEQAPLISAASVVEVGAVLLARGARSSRKDLADFLRESGVRVEPVDRSQAEFALDAIERYGKGRGHPGQLNFGDCFSYALAKATGKPLLFKGADFSKTDVTLVL